MRTLNAALLSVAIPFLSQAGTLIYPEMDQKQVTPADLPASLQVVSDHLGLGLDAKDFRFKEAKESLLGKHYYFQQVVNGQFVEGGDLVISTDSMKVTKVYHNLVSAKLKKLAPAIPLISQTNAIESAWYSLKVDGELLDSPSAQLLYTRSLVLAYRINLSVSSPFGHYEVLVDAHTGKVIEAKDAAIPRMKRAEKAPRLVNKRNLVSFASAMNKFESKKQKNMFEVSGKMVHGTAVVFNPNPVVALGRTDLQDNSPRNVFYQAYTNEYLLDITYANGAYFLRGPKVTLADFEHPRVAPSTTANGQWVFERGNKAFNDAMTYLHLDRSIRYIESLGFQGGRKVFPRSIEVDANGVEGADNSHYIPSSRRLAFGHGCVDDNEDADVILHELGHAIQHHINPSWSGGDTGAMGEGFGDYWAASYSVATEGGLNTQPNWVFKWDGHNACWPGRKLNAFTPVYDARRTYAAHMTVNGGISDELWSTPIFQALLELYLKGVPRGVMDKIILQAHFGLGAGVKMPDMARSIVKTAQVLFPGRGFDQVYLRHFQKMKIL